MVIKKNAARACAYYERICVYRVGRHGRTILQIGAWLPLQMTHASEDIDAHL